VALVALACSAWLANAQLARAQRETRSVEQLAAGRGRWVDAGDAALYVQEWGDPEKPTLLLTHGTGAWSGTWFELPYALADAGWHVVAVDLPPFGLSKTREDGPRADYSRPAQAQRLLHLLDSVRKPVTLVGHSFGAGPAFEAAMLAGDRVRQLVLVDPALGLGPNGEAARCEPHSDGLLSLRDLRTSLVAATATWPGLTGTWLKQFVHRKEVVTEHLLAPYRAPFERADFSARLGDWATAFSASACEPAASLDPQRVRAWARGGPAAALVWGEQDSITPIAQSRTLQAWMPQATLSVLPGVGHIPHIESPREFTGQLIAILESATSPQP
jgi:pimeloyl-ACP methyl ester carboxylesterase